MKQYERPNKNMSCDFADLNVGETKRPMKADPNHQ